jgi:RecJ-like exonuclease
MLRNKVMSKHDEIEVTLYNEDGDEEVVSFPAKMEVCDMCEGFGSHLNPSIGEHAYSAEEFCEDFDEEEREEYFRHGGRFDVTCEECKGKNVVKVIDREACKLGDLAEKLALYDKDCEERAAFAREQAAERRMGA